jgi:putative tryptophan/tyrosine transport system substrate-binding protein
LSNQANQATAKRFQLLLEIAPAVASVVHLTDTVASEATGGFREVQQAAQALGLQLVTPVIRTAADLPPAFALAQRSQVKAVSVAGAVLMLAEQASIVAFATDAGLPLVAQDRNFPAAGGLLSYGPSRLALYRRAATYADKIVHGAKPADLPVEQPTVFDFVVNVRTAQTLGLMIPPSVLQQVTEIIQ